MAKEELIPWYLKSKTMWGVALIVLGSVMSKFGFAGGDIVRLIGMALVFIGLRHAIHKGQ